MSRALCFPPVLLRNYTRGKPFISLGTEQQAMPELMEKKVYFSAHHHCHDRIEQQAVISIYQHAAVLACKVALGCHRHCPAGFRSIAIWSHFAGLFSKRL